MLNIKDYLNYENDGKQYLIKLKSNQEVVAYVDEAKLDNPDFYSFYIYDSCDVLENSEIEEVLQELPEDFTDNCDSCDDGKINLQLALNGETACDNCKQRQQGLIKFKTSLPNVYKYNSIEELQELYKLLDCPIPNGVDKDWNTETLIVDDLKHSFGLVYTWSNWDDFSDYPLDYCAVIDGGLLSD